MELDELEKNITEILLQNKIDIEKSDGLFYRRFINAAPSITELFTALYGSNNNSQKHYNALLQTIVVAYTNRNKSLKSRDSEKQGKEKWFVSSQLVGMSLYVDKFCGSLNNLTNKLPYLQTLGVNLLHLMPIMESPANESDGGYAVSNFRQVDARFGTNNDLAEVQQNLLANNMYLMMDIVLNHTSQQHEWAVKAIGGDAYYQDFFYLYKDKNIVDYYNSTMPEIFPESSPGSFTYNEAMQKWVMTVFHNYQWDLNFSNPNVFIAMLDTVFYYANIGVDILRIDAPAFIWKKMGTTCQNLDEAHQLLCLIKQCVQVATPGMALLGEAIVAPKEIIKYFGTNKYLAKECDIAYAATNMALQWDALATADTTVMLAAQPDILKKPNGTTWITYTRCHDDIGLGYDDTMIASAGYQPYEHRKFIKEYYSGTYPNTTATGALFSVNPKTQDARISGTLASLCGLESAIYNNDRVAVKTAIDKIILLQAQTLLIGGIAMLYYGDEVGYTNDYTYLNDSSKSYDNRWMHRPQIDWQKNDLYKLKNTVAQRVFTATQQAIAIRRSNPVFNDVNNIDWMAVHNKHIAAFVRYNDVTKVICLFNYASTVQGLTWYAFKQKGMSGKITNLCNGETYLIANDNEFINLQPYEYMVLQVG